MRKTTHPLYKTYHNIKQRCLNKNNPRYKDYGGRGIVLAEDWSNDFWSFVRDIGERPTIKHSIDRIDNSRGYTKDNCKWATAIEQGSNTRNNHYYTYMGITHLLCDWARIFECSAGSLQRQFAATGEFGRPKNRPKGFGSIRRNYNKWQVMLSPDSEDKQIQLGRYDTEIEAEQALMTYLYQLD